MLMIRLQRIGRKNDPAFRIAVLEKTAGPKAGKYVDLLGTYNPKTKAMTVDGDRVKTWVGNGAQLSPTLHNLLVTKGIIEGKLMNVLPKKTFPKKEEPIAAPASEAETPTEEAPAEAPAEEVTEAPAPEAPAEETPEAAPAEEAPAEEPAEQTA